MAAYARIMSTAPAMRAMTFCRKHFAVGWPPTRRWKGPEQTCNFLRDAISSIRSNIFRHKKVVRRLEGERAYKQEDEEDEPLDRAADPSASTEGPLFVQQVYDLCDDEEIKDLLTAQVDRATPEEIKAELGWDDTKYETVQKRKRRLVIRLMREGKLHERQSQLGPEETAYRRDLGGDQLVERQGARRLSGEYRPSAGRSSAGLFEGDGGRISAPKRARFEEARRQVRQKQLPTSARSCPSIWRERSTFMAAIRDHADRTNAMTIAARNQKIEDENDLDVFLEACCDWA